ncbi:small CPxCG-related zinc finger protein [Natronomonas moolapensis 8.8.11]|uniref:Small CPxCG-related zinc finger protein n=1 Tax=Natronomonas moolapensis (strain DSM 18674 / CECT 7526 / JCM 14361 / 8.8.11) TaxID=268739 RepID=M1XZY0_NATM8|nr:hypothetical protein [Natronomonas moolapensis]CCQ35741.1 small CPxCG-related zinc finger protein [Natronomonas moolapensis 8.8.11]
MYSLDGPSGTRLSDDGLECPTCAKPLVMGLPNDATIEAVARRPVGDRSGPRRTKTRKVVCRSGHEVYVTFSVAARGGRILG